ncbi:MAG: restriction endonuclease subunit S [Allosphingosinicella sp.]|uniref:restriction endonuclease subunit S n=1 Tax=Allosphingosinicella sp. TaxID=2823234 RepID=UPI003952F2A2
MSFVADLSALVDASTDPRLCCPDGWTRVPLGSIAKIINGFPFKSGGFGAVGHPVIRIRDVARGFTNTQFDGAAPDGYWVEAGELVVGMDGDFQTAFWRSDRALLNQRVCKIVPDETRIDRRYLAYILPGYLELINANTPSVTVKHLSSRTLASIPVPLPSLDRQVRIADRIDELFVEIDDGEAALARARDDLETWRKALLKAAVTGELTADWRAANPSTETGTDLLTRILVERRSRWQAEPKNKGKGYKEPLAPSMDSLPTLPAGWVWASFDQLVDQLSNGISAKPAHAPPGIPILRISSVRPMLVRDDQRRWLSQDFAVGGALARKGDLLFTRYNGNPGLVGVCGRYRGEIPVAYPDKVMCATPSSCNDAVGDFLELAMNAGASRRHIAASTKTSAGQHGVSGSSVKVAPVPIPPQAELEHIVQVYRDAALQAEDGWSDANELTAISTTLRQSILAAAFRGELA